MSYPAQSSRRIQTIRRDPDKSPNEHAAEAWWNSSRGGIYSQRVSAGPCVLPRHDVPPWSVRVKWFVGPPNYTALMDQKYVYHDFPLEPSGALNYETVKRRWNLSQNCFVFRYRRASGAKVFYPEDKNWINPQELKLLLGDDRSLSIIEEPTQAELQRRRRRAEDVDVTNDMRATRILVWNQAGKCYDAFRLLFLAAILPVAVYTLFIYPYLKLRTYDNVSSYHYGILILFQIAIVQYVYDLGQDVIEDREFQIPPTPSPSPAPAD